MDSSAGFQLQKIQSKAVTINYPGIDGVGCTRRHGENLLENTFSRLLRTLHGIVWRNFLRPHHGLAQQLYHKRCLGKIDAGAASIDLGK